ncbi:MAG: stage III sporulation protein AA [Lachnospiraceae bacterium]|nr:stage III sporulation protein AA [Lachnospiraceae bacterium]
MDKLELLHHIFPKNIQNMLEKAPITYYKLQEVRLRVNEPLIIIYDNKEYLFGKNGQMERQCKFPYIVSATEIKETLEYVSSHSLYAYEDEIRQGFITVQGGHRVGIAGKVVVEEGMIKNVKYISFLNIRISHQVLGCSDGIMPYITKRNEIFHTLIISPPRCGKTTLLRDMIRSISNGFEEFQGATVGVVDERSEIGACFLGEPQNDLGIRTDVLDCCPKAKGMLMLIRSMSPQVIAVDEIGHREDLEAIEYVINCGCKLIATVHGNSIDDIKSKPLLRKLVQERVFERYIVLNNMDHVGNISDIFDSQGNQLYHV